MVTARGYYSHLSQNKAFGDSVTCFLHGPQGSRSENKTSSKFLIEKSPRAGRESTDQQTLHFSNEAEEMFFTWGESVCLSHIHSLSLSPFSCFPKPFFTTKLCFLTLIFFFLKQVSDISLILNSFLVLDNTTVVILTRKPTLSPSKVPKQTLKMPEVSSFCYSNKTK